MIAYSFYDCPQKRRCRELIGQGGLVNTICFVEAFNIIQYEAGREHAEMAIRALLKSSLTVVDVDLGLVFEALKSSGKYGRLRFIDLLHYTTALLHNCSEIASFDDDFGGLEIPRIT